MSGPGGNGTIVVVEDQVTVIELDTPDHYEIVLDQPDGPPTLVEVTIPVTHLIAEVTLTNGGSGGGGIPEGLTYAPNLLRSGLDIIEGSGGGPGGPDQTPGFLIGNVGQDETGWVPGGTPYLYMQGDPALAEGTQQQVMLSGQGLSVGMYNPAEGENLGMSVNFGGIHTYRFSPAGSMYATTSPNGINLYDSGASVSLSQSGLSMAKPAAEYPFGDEVTLNVEKFSAQKYISATEIRYFEISPTVASGVVSTPTGPGTALIRKFVVDSAGLTTQDDTAYLNVSSTGVTYGAMSADGLRSLDWADVALRSQMPDPLPAGVAWPPTPGTLATEEALTGGTVPLPSPLPAGVTWPPAAGVLTTSEATQTLIDQIEILPAGTLWPPAPGTLATVEAITAGQIPIPWDAIQSPVGANFRGPWRAYGEVVYFQDFVDGLPVGLMTSRSDTGSTLSLGLMPIAQTPFDRRPNLPSAQVATVQPVGAPEGQKMALDVNLSALGLPPTVEITRVLLHAGRMYTSQRTSTIVGHVDGLPAVLGLNNTWQSGWGTAIYDFTAGVSNASTVGIQMDNASYSPDINYRDVLGITGITVYGTHEAGYLLGDTVTYGGRLWQSITDGNQDEPGTTLRWTDIGAAPA